MKPYYEHAGITIFHGDCREILPTLPHDALFLTDPPYGIALANHGKKDGRRRRTDFEIVGDRDSTIGQFVIDFLQDAPLIAFASAMKPWSGNWDQWLCWDKGLAVGGGGDPRSRWKFTWELIQVARLGTLEGQRDGSVLRFPMLPSDSADHPAEKPESLCTYLIRKCCKRMVIDPFCGTGSAIVAAKGLRLNAIGIEIEERYCEIAAKRLGQEVMDFGPVNKPEEFMRNLGAQDLIYESLLDRKPELL